MAASEAAGAARLRIMCSHGGRFLPCGPDGGVRYVGGETRILVVPREVSFRELETKLGKMAGAAVATVRYRLVDEDLEDVLVSVTCDEELAHMRDEYDRLRSKRPSRSFRVFVSTTVGVQRRTASGLPPLAPTMRRVKSEQALAGRARLHPCAAGQAPMRLVQSAHELAAAGSRFHPCDHHKCRFCHHCGDPPMHPVPSMSKNAHGARRSGPGPKQLRSI